MKTMLLTSLFCLIFGQLSFAQSTSGPADSQITNVALSGSGCDMSRASVTLSPDAKDLSVLFDDYTVEIGNGTEAGPVAGKQKNCQILLDVSIPDGWQFAFKSVDYRGFVALPASAWAFHRFSALVTNSPIVSMREVMHKGPVNDNYTFHTEIKPTRWVWSPCHRTQQQITLVSQMAVNFYPQSTDRSSALIAIDSSDLSTKQSFSVEWRRCN